MIHYSAKKMQVKPFEYMEYKHDDSNAREIMAWVGLSKEEIEQEMVYHMGGSPFMIGGKELMDTEGDIVIKWSDGKFELVHKHEIERFINISPS